jgi:hypothetical protein
MHGYSIAFAVACGLFLAGAVATAALLRSDRPPDQTPSVDVGALQRRIAELEDQNRLLQQALHTRDVAAAR